MTNLDPNFSKLPTPKPPKNIKNLLKKQLRLAALQVVAQKYKYKSVSDDGKLNKILLIRPDHLGDLLFLTPAIRYLRSLLPKAHLTLMVGSWGKELMQNNPHLNQILTCEFPGFTRQAKPSAQQPYQYLVEQAKHLKTYQFDQAIILRFDHWWGAWLAAAADIPHRFGFKVSGVTPFLTHTIPYKDQRHEVEQNWRLVHFAWSRGILPVVESWSEAEIIGPTEFFMTPEDETWCTQWYHEKELNTQQSLIIFHPGAGAVVKQWRTQAWVNLAQSLIKQHKIQLILSGSPAERNLCQKIAAQISPAPIIAAGETRLSQLAALMNKADLVIGSDTGPLKLAAAVNTPTLQLYGPVDPVKFGPWGNPEEHRYVTAGLSCSPCNHLDYTPAEVENHFCIRGLSMQVVLKEANKLLLT